MDKQKVITVLRTTLALAVWLTVVKLYGAFIDPLRCCFSSKNIKSLDG
ncbi:MAG: hypothetical protein J6Z43_05370 [Clostridiales bacterium]|nr:hypothetical protein [Clostridiales bacterium]